MDTIQMEQRLWEYIDGTCSDAEKVEIEVLLKTHPLWKATYDEFIEVQALLRASELEQPSLRFTQNVMEQIALGLITPATKIYINKKVIYGIGGFFLVMIAGLLVYGVGRGDWYDTGSLGMSFDLSNIQWNKVFNNTYTTVFMMMNVVLALVLIDKFLSGKKRHSRQKHS